MARVARAPQLDVPLTQAIADSIRELDLNRWPEILPPPALEAQREMWNQGWFPARLPQFNRILVSDEGRVWMQSWWNGSDLAGAPPSWIVFDRGGYWLGTVPVPASYTVHAMGADCALIERRDADGVEYVEIFSLAFRTDAR